MSTGAERREARRFTMSLPLRVLDGPRSGREIETETRDVSYRGLYFISESEFEAGKAINFVITLPENVTGGDVKIRCQGEVVRVEPGVNGRLGVAAKIEHYEFVPTAAVV
jgi:PilZ domain